MSAIEAFAASLAGEFPQAHRINGGTVTFVAGQAPPTPAVLEVLGIRLTNAEQSRVLQVRKQGFSYSHLAPYSKWETFVGEMRRYWDLYAAAFAPTSLTRLAVRFINQIPVPVGVDIGLYLTLTPQLLPVGGMQVEGYFMQLVLPQTDLGEGWKAIVNTGLGGRVTPESMHLLLDLDVFYEGVVDAGGDRLWTTLQSLRERKNELFEAAITGETRRLIQ